MKNPSPQGSADLSITEAELAEDRFFAALLAGDAEQLELLLMSDFLIVDVMSGAAADRAAFIAAPFAAASCYTHVLGRERDGRWRLASAQGRPIVEAQPR